VRYLAALALGTVLLALPVGCGGDDAPARQYAGMVRDPAPVVDGNALPDATRDGRPMTLRASEGGLLLVYFGYTECPDVCPTTMGDVRTALDELTPAERGRVRVAMVTVDPDRDTNTVLSNYIHAFFRDGHALRTGDPRLLARVAKAFGAGYEVTKAKDGTVEVAHTAYTYAVDEEGRLRLQWAFGTPARDFQEDIRALLRDSGSS
jgi:protein SCO1/2